MTHLGSQVTSVLGTTFEMFKILMNELFWIPVYVSGLRNCRHLWRGAPRFQQIFGDLEMRQLEPIMPRMTIVRLLSQNMSQRSSSSVRWRQGCCWAGGPWSSPSPGSPASSCCWWRRPCSDWNKNVKSFAVPESLTWCSCRAWHSWRLACTWHSWGCRGGGWGCWRGSTGSLTITICSTSWKSQERC